MDRHGALPDRCVICNQPAGGHRVVQKLYWSPLAWRIGAWTTPFVILGIGIARQVWWLAAAFWPTVILLVLVNFLVRKSLSVELGICARHRNIRQVLQVLSIACIAALAALIWSFSHGGFDERLMWGVIGGIVLLAALQAFTGIRTLKLKKVSPEHAWLAGAGKPFRAALPELAGPA